MQPVAGIGPRWMAVEHLPRVVDIGPALCLTRPRLQRNQHHHDPTKDLAQTEAGRSCSAVPLHPRAPPREHLPDRRVAHHRVEHQLRVRARRSPCRVVVNQSGPDRHHRQRTAAGRRAIEGSGPDRSPSPRGGSACLEGVVSAESEFGSCSITPRCCWRVSGMAGRRATYPSLRVGRNQPAGQQSSAAGPEVVAPKRAHSRKLFSWPE